MDVLTPGGQILIYLLKAEVCGCSLFQGWAFRHDLSHCKYAENQFEANIHRKKNTVVT